MISTGETVDAAEENENKPAARRGMGAALAIVCSAFVVGVVIQHAALATAIDSPAELRIWSVVFGLIAFTLMIAAGWNTAWQKFVSSNRFSVPSVLFLTALAIGGTLILQNEPEAVLVRAYGSSLKLIRALFLEDLFHSFGFTAVVGLSAGGLALVIVRKRSWSIRYAGSVGAHLGLLLVLAGATVGNVWGVKGRLNMHVGQSSNQFLVSTGRGVTAGYPLGFEVRLDDFRLVRYEPEFRLMVFSIEGERESLLLSADPTSIEREMLRDYGVEVLGYWPDYVGETIVKPVEGEPNSPKLSALALSGPNPADEPKWMFDSGSDPPEELELGNDRLVFVWSQERAKRFIESLPGKRSDSPHVLAVGGRELRVEQGGIYSLPGSDHRIEVRRALVDFVLDVDSRKPENRSDRPNNPAIEVVLKDSRGEQLARTWLFAKHAGFHGQQGSPLAGLRYRYAGGEASGLVKWIAVGQLAQLWVLAEKEIEARIELKRGAAIQLNDAGWRLHALHEHVERSIRHRSRSDRPENPMIQVRIAGKPPVMIVQRQPIRLSGSKRVMVLAPKGGESVRDYLSQVTILEEGRQVLTRTVEVNHPLEYAGYTFYQSDYRPDDPTFSGFQVVRDPGLWIVYLGFLVNAVGVGLALLISPMLRRKRSVQGVGAY